MEAYKKEFIDFMVESKVLKFGDFTLKSGRKSPFFMNAGAYVTGSQLKRLGEYYAKAIHDNYGTDFDVLFGPAYKGIPIVAATSIAYASLYNEDAPWVFNRKEAKDHGEGGNLVGSPLAGNVVLIDDVITAGTAIRESMEIIAKEKANLSGVLIALDRKERGKADLSAIQEIERDYKTKVVSIINLNDLITYIEQSDELKHHIQSVKDYRAQYGVD